MVDDENVFSEDDPRDERRAAEDRIDRIRGRNESAAPPPPLEELDQPRDDTVVSRARIERTVYADDSEVFVTEEEAFVPDYAGVAPSRIAFLLIGALVLFGIAVVLLLFWLQGTQPGGMPALFGGPTPTMTLTPTPEATLTPTTPPTLTPTSTPEAPFLPLPPLACAYEAGTSCVVYCQDPANQTACANSRTFVESQGADFDYWLSCVSEGTADPQTCMEEAWRVLR